MYIYIDTHSFYLSVSFSPPLPPSLILGEKMFQAAGLKHMVVPITGGEPFCGCRIIARALLFGVSRASEFWKLPQLHASGRMKQERLRSTVQRLGLIRRSPEGPK